MPIPAWLTARRVAHRGLHSPQGPCENSLGAALEAIERGYAIECDVQLSRDGVPMVFHDERLERLTHEIGDIGDFDADTLERFALKGGGGTIARLSRFLDTINARTPVIIELKSRFDGDLRLAEAVAAVTLAYAGPVAVMSFDPRLVKPFRRLAPHLPRGLVACRFDDDEWTMLRFIQKLAGRFLLYGFACRIDFIAYDQKALPALAPFIARHIFARKLLSWTVRSEETKQRLRPYVDQVIFEGFTPLD